MPSIKVLPPDLRNKIAAGEVIERPASVVKELVENSIDAGSTDIRVEVLYGGKRLIKVSDNGCGMDREDALLCFERHATSKLLEENGLFDIRTLGFRGEALPSISSVSKIKLVTGRPGLACGISVEIMGGEIKEVKDSPFSGTSIEVRELFFNTPARKKFLKADSTELLHAIDAVTKEALSHYQIGFTLWTDNRETMVLPKASGLRERLLQVYGKEFLDGLSEIDGGNGMMTLKAFVSKDRNFRSGKAHQFIYINNRPVRDASLSHSVYKAYEGILPAEKHPVFFLFLEIEPAVVDFNVHPAKREVRFQDKEGVYRFVGGCLRKIIKTQRTEYAGQFSEVSETGPRGQAAYAELSSPQVVSGTAYVSEGAELSYRPALPFIYLGDTFIAASGRGGLTLIDHHAAHERILYEKFLNGLSLDKSQLLFPEPVKLSHKEYMVIMENKNLILEFGLEVDDFGHDTLIIRSIPEALKGADLRGILSDLASDIIERKQPQTSLRATIAAKIACHRSVRGREVLNRDEFARLLSDLEQTENPDQCPHGRPTRIFYSLDDLKKMFGRK